MLDRVKESGDIFLAWSDEPWVLNGAAVRISIVGFDDGNECNRTLDGEPVPAINADLTRGIDFSRAAGLVENRDIAFQGLMKAGPFDIDPVLAETFLSRPVNPNGRPNVDVVHRWVGGEDLVGARKQVFVIDFGEMPESEAAYYELPFEHVRTHVKPLREGNRDAQRRKAWWLFGRSGGNLRSAIAPLDRFLATSRVSRHRIFVWLDADVRASNKICVFARQDDYFFGVLHSRPHEVWSLRMGSWHGVGNDPVYTPTTCFETFPLPWPPGQEPADDPRVQGVAAAARELDAKRRAWIDPPGETDQAVLKDRTLTKLYNARPTWLAHLHAALDRAVWAAYGWEGDPAETADEAILGRLLALNAERAGR